MSQYTENKLVEKNPNTAWMQVMNLIDEGSTILDIGCSSGTLGHELITKKGCIVDGIELDDGDVSKAKTKLRKVAKMNVETDDLLSEFSGQYDAVLFIDVIEHLIDPVGALRKVKRLLKNGGKIVFSLPNMAHVSIRLDLLDGEFTYTKTGLLDRTHLHFYTGKEIQNVFGAAGLTIDKFDCSSLTYPIEYLRSRLKGIGLNVTHKFTEHLRNTHGDVYQYVGTAIAAKGAATQLTIPTVNAHERDHNDIRLMFVEYREYIKRLEASLNDKTQQVETLEEERRQFRKNPLKTAIKWLKK